MCARHESKGTTFEQPPREQRTWGPSGLEGVLLLNLRMLPHPKLLRVLTPVVGLVPLAYLGEVGGKGRFRLLPSSRTPGSCYAHAGRVDAACILGGWEGGERYFNVAWCDLSSYIC